MIGLECRFGEYVWIILAYDIRDMGIGYGYVYRENIVGLLGQMGR